MERLLTDEDRIRRAEDIAKRRSSFDFYESQDIEEKKNNKYGKLIVKILVCLCIYCGLYYVKNTNNDNYKELLTNIKNVLEYDVNFKEIYDSFYSKIQIILKKDESNGIVENNIEELVNDSNQENISDIVGIGGELDNESINDANIELNENEIQSDSEYIKEKISLINPLEGSIITSQFGEREPSSIVSANHRGIDLGASTGTIIVSASDGVVTEASSLGDFGLHLIIQNEDVTMVYGHCSELLVNEGDFVTQGEQIAKVGATGKATGPHLHFEVRRDDRVVDPQLLLEF